MMLIDCLAYGNVTATATAQVDHSLVDIRLEEHLKGTSFSLTISLAQCEQLLQQLSIAKQLLKKEGD